MCIRDRDFPLFLIYACRAHKIIFCKYIKHYIFNTQNVLQSPDLVQSTSLFFTTHKRFFSKLDDWNSCNCCCKSNNGKSTMCTSKMSYYLLTVTSTVSFIELQCLRWLSHIHIMSTDRSTKTDTGWKFIKVMSRGFPKNSRWNMLEKI